MDQGTREESNEGIREGTRGNNQEPRWVGEWRQVGRGGVDDSSLLQGVRAGGGGGGGGGGSEGGEGEGRRGGFARRASDGETREATREETQEGIRASDGEDGDLEYECGFCGKRCVLVCVS